MSDEEELSDSAKNEPEADNQNDNIPATANDEEDDFAFQLRQEAEERQRLANTQGAETSNGTTLNSAGVYTYTDPNDGTVYEWDGDKKAWFPKIDDDFLARYQAQYGSYTETQTTASQAASQGETSHSTEPKPVPDNLPPEDLTPEERKEWLKQRKKEKRKLMAERQKQPAHWFDIDDSQNTHVYVSGMPPDISLKEFEEVMSKCGIIARELDTRKPKLKLYVDSDGNNKGDGLCAYIKKESVDLALQILDGGDVRGRQISVQKAQFEQKGDYDPSKKRKKLSTKQKKRLMEKQEKLFDWRPDKLRGERPKGDRTVIIRRLFTLEELAKNAALLFDYENDLKAECSKYGEVKKVVIYDNNPEGVASVTFKEPESADDCITMMDYRHFKGKQLRAERWDGMTKYKIEETDEERRKRLAQWEQYLQEGDREEGKQQKEKS